MALGVNIVSQFNSKGIQKAIKDFKTLKTGTDKAAFSLKTMDGAITNGIKGFAKYGGIVAGVSGIIGKSLVDAAYESRKVMAQTEAIIQATGGAAGKTAKSVQAMSEALSMQVGVDDEVIQKSANLLLTFKQVQNVAGQGNQIFDRAMNSVLDLGNVFGSTDSAAMQLGKALSNPIKGVGALARAGINFTDQQKAQIKTLVQSGKVLEAQKIILGEVEAQVGGTAKASATGFDRMKVALGNTAEELGDVLIPYVEKFADFVIKSVVPVLQQFSYLIGEKGLGTAINYLAGSIIKAVWNMGTMGKVITIAIGLFGALKVAVVTFTAVETIMAIAAKVATGALLVQIEALNATRIAMLAAGGVTAILAVAGTMYALYAANKKTAVEQTENFSDALYAEVDAQKRAIAELAMSDPVFGDLLRVSKAYGLSIGDLTQYLKTGEGKFSDFSVILGSAAAQSGNLADHQGMLGKKFVLAAQAAGLTGQELDNVYFKLEALNKQGFQTRSTQDLLGSLGLSTTTPTTIGNTETALEKLKKKLKSYADLVKGSSGYQRDLKKAIESTGLANDKLAEANRKLTTAQQNLLNITKGFGASSKQALSAQEEYEQAQRDGVRAGFELEKANQAVLDAEKELVKARMRGNPTEIRDAEIALSEAQMTVTEKQIALRNATDATAEAQRKLNGAISGFPQDSEEYKSAMDELIDAQKEAKDATDAVADAKDRELEITNKLIAANKQLAKLKITKKQAKQVATSMKSQGITITPEMWQTLGITPFAKGGIVTSPVNALIGEAGAEAVIPLDRMEGLMNGGNTYITVEVTSADPTAVVDALRRYQRQNGALPLRVTG